MSKWAWYNEFNPHAAQWLRNLISRGLIAPGEVDERSIEDVTPDDLRSFTQCHFFAGIGVWSYALRLAGWPDDRPVWTGSCPCQPFSAAGKGVGFDDERHLWPAWHWLIGERRPPRIYGEQVTDGRGLAWLDLVQSDLEGSGYASGALDLSVAGVGAPHIRQRTFLVADAARSGFGAGLRDCEPPRQRRIVIADGRRDVELADAESFRLFGRPDDGDGGRGQRASGPRRSFGVLGDACGERRERYGRNGDDRDQSGWFRAIQARPVAAGVPAIELADTDGWNARAARQQRSGEQRFEPQDGNVVELADTPQGRRREFGRENFARDVRHADCGVASDRLDDGRRPGPVNGLWRDADWLFCTDGKWRPVEPGTQPLVDGSAFKLGAGGPYENKSRAKMLHGAGNAINAELAAWFIRATM